MGTHLSTQYNIALMYPLRNAVCAGIRRATGADDLAIRSLISAAYVEWSSAARREPGPKINDFNVTSANHMVDLLHLGGELAGIVAMQVERDHLLIANVAVSPAFQGCGYAHALVAHAEEQARSFGFGKVSLSLNEQFVESMRLYGYRVDEEEPASHGRALCMSKNLG